MDSEHCPPHKLGKGDKGDTVPFIPLLPQRPPTLMGTKGNRVTHMALLLVEGYLGSLERQIPGVTGIPGVPGVWGVEYGVVMVVFLGSLG